MCVYVCIYICNIFLHSLLMLEIYLMCYHFIIVTKMICVPDVEICKLFLEMTLIVRSCFRVSVLDPLEMFLVSKSCCKSFA